MLLKALISDSIFALISNSIFPSFIVQPSQHFHLSERGILKGDWLLCKFGRIFYLDQGQGCWPSGSQIYNIVHRIIKLWWEAIWRGMEANVVGSWLYKESNWGEGGLVYSYFPLINGVYVPEEGVDRRVWMGTTDGSFLVASLSHPWRKNHQFKTL